MPFLAKSTMGETIQAGVGKSSQEQEYGGFGGVFTITCFDADGNLKWEDSFHNLVVNVGLQDLNTQYFKGSGYTAAWYLGLVTGPGSGVTYAAADTLASKAWTEFTNYTGNRKAVTFGTATTADPSVISNSASQAVYTISGAGGTVAGAFLSTVATGTSGTLFSEGNFTGGDKVVASGDTLNVTYTFNADAA
jgi:hypothetical protein